MRERSKQSVQQTSREGQENPITRHPSEGGQGLAHQGRWSALAGGSPFSVVRRMMEDMDRFFETFGSAGNLFPGLEAPRQALGTWSPDVEVSQHDGSLTVCADLPGMRKEDIEIELQGDTLILRGQRHEEHEEQRGNVSYSERSYGSFVRTVALPTRVEPEEVDATFQNGVLRVTLQLPEESRRRRIQIHAGGAEREGRDLTTGSGDDPPQDKSAHN
jgi:HSP20 family protein